MSAPSSIQLKRPALSAENGDAGMLLLLVAPRVVRHRLRARLGCSSAVHAIVSHFLQSKQEMLSVIYSSINRICCHLSENRY
jgi:hypothetical protein